MYKVAYALLFTLVTAQAAFSQKYLSQNDGVAHLGYMCWSGYEFYEAPPGQHRLWKTTARWWKSFAENQHQEAFRKFTKSMPGEAATQFAKLSGKDKEAMRFFCDMVQNVVMNGAPRYSRTRSESDWRAGAWYAFSICVPARCLLRKFAVPRREIQIR